MPSSYTTSNRLEKQATGENTNSWGTRLNAYTTDMLDESLDGLVLSALCLCHNLLLFASENTAKLRQHIVSKLKSADPLSTSYQN